MPVTFEHYGADGRRKDVAGAIRFVDHEEPVGVINGVNTVFTLANIPNPPEGLYLFWNGMEMDQGDDYNLDDDEITFTFPPSAGKLRATYRY